MRTLQEIRYKKQFVRIKINLTDGIDYNLFILNLRFCKFRNPLEKNMFLRKQLYLFFKKKMKIKTGNFYL